VDVESDVMLSSGSVLMSSAGDCDDVMDESWMQQQQQQQLQLDVDVCPPDTDTLPHSLLNHCPLDVGQSSKTAFGSNNCPDDDVSKASGNTDSATATCGPTTSSRASVTDSDTSNLSLHSQATSVNYYEAFEPAAQQSVKTSIDADKQIQLPAAAESVSEQNSPELADNENDQSAAVKERVLASATATETQLATTDAAKADADLQTKLGHVSDEIQNASNAGVDEVKTPSIDADSCQSSSHFQSVEPTSQKTTESSAGKSELSSETVRDSAANSDVMTKTRKHDRKNIEKQTTASKQQIPSGTDKTSSKKETGSSTKDKLEEPASGSRTAARNPRSTRSAVVSTTSKERRSPGSVDTVQPGDKNTTDKSKRRRDNDTSRPDIDDKGSLKSASTQKASDRTATTSSAAAGRRDAAERSSSQIKKSKTGTVANAEPQETPDRAESKKSLSTAAAKRITGRKIEPQNADDHENKVDDKAKETTSKLVNDNPKSSNQESTNQTRSLASDVRNPGKETRVSARKSPVAKNNPKPEDADKDAETRRGEKTTSNGKQRTKSSGSNPTNPQSVGSTGADRPAEKLSEDHSSSGNPGNPRTVTGDRATTSGQSKETAKKQPPAAQRSASSRITTKPTTTGLQNRGASQTARTTQRADKPADMAAAAAGDSKTPRTSSTYSVIFHLASSLA